MNCSCKTDRYKTYKDIDCEGNAKSLVQMLRKHLDDPEKTNAYWEKLKQILDQIEDGQLVNGKRMDNLFFIHCYINNVRDFFELHCDDEAQALLEKIEIECC